MDSSPNPIQFSVELQEVRDRTLRLIADLDDEQMMGQRLEIVNPLRWEIGHIAWFQEYWVLRYLRGRTPILANGGALYDSAKVAHETRWDLPLPSKAETLAYMHNVLDQVLDDYVLTRAHSGLICSTNDPAYFLSLVLFHEDMHAEAITYTRQTLGYPAPQLTVVDRTQRTGTEDLDPKKACEKQPERDRLGDSLVPSGKFLVGSTEIEGFVFDNEMGAHEVYVQPFSISRTAVTNAEYAAFVDDRGYHRRELWCKEGWEWRKKCGADHPVYWKLAEGQRLCRNFDQMVQLEDYLPIVHVNWFEADAYCRWAKRRLPTEVEWEIAASGESMSDGGVMTKRRRRFPWGNQMPTAERANLDSRAMGCIDVRSLPDGDSAFGCRQMIGNVWEWTASDFLPYPDFVAGPYKEYSAPWFADHKVLRGGCWATRSRLIHNTYRNFYKPDRRDVWAGFRTCAP
jgi:iron(II)-dependent oxidoreductase